MCSQQLSVLDLMNNLLTSEISSSTMSLLFKNHWLVEVTYQLIRFNKINFFLWNTKNSDRYGVNMQNKHQNSLRERWDWKVLVIMKISDRYPQLLKQPPYFTKPHFLWVKSQPPLLFGKISKIQTFFYKGGELQLWARLLISFSPDIWLALYWYNWFELSQFNFFWINV